ncbi:MAG: ADP-forming succinate--CoA ligase subunit beta [Actinobacteria bacterium]|nr:ADP-forming succinate--CoA ligase subunit beta [Actinomycetota bacterium]
MKIHEHQAKQLLAARGIPVPAGQVARSVEEAAAAVRPLIEESNNPVVVLKAQIHAGGRGKGSFEEHRGLRGVNVITEGIEGGPAAAEEKVRRLSKKMLGSTLVTVQTGEEGKTVNRLYLEQGVDIATELYLAILLDRARSRNIVMASTEGGVEIEKVAEETPEKIIRAEIDPAIGLAQFQANELAHGLGLEGEVARNFQRFVKALAAAATELDADLIEINPLVVTGSGKVMALDAKMSFDDNALFRHPEIAEMRDESEEDPAEVAAKNAGLSYIKLDGKIGCMVNGAGLAMATMDIIKLYGSEPANFLDVGGGATKEKVTEAFKIITSDPKVKGILVNIFGGIMRCDVIAEGVVAAVKEVGLKVPLVVRLEGTNVERGKQILNESGLDVVNADSLLDGAEKILELTAPADGAL